jgi:hypothetical protein
MVNLRRACLACQSLAYQRGLGFAPAQLASIQEPGEREVIGWIDSQTIICAAAMSAAILWSGAARAD